MAGLTYTVLILLFEYFVSSNEPAASGKINTFYKLPLGPNERGPETIAFDCKGQGPYVGISDGRILKWQGQDIGWTEFAVTSANRSDLCNGIDENSPMEKDCGRPLGLEFDLKTCELYIADSRFGLMKVGQNGGIASSLATSAQGIPFMFLNALDIDSGNQLVYFTDTSARYHHWEALQAINSGDQTGRLMMYDAKTGNVTVLLKDLSFANGVALSLNKDYVIVAETTTSQIRKYWLTGTKSGSSEVFLKLTGTPDNIHRNANGDFWIALRKAKSIKVNNLGRVIETLESDEIVNPSDVQEFHQRIWVGFVDQPYIFHT